jgi:hypothetical protein
LFSLELNNFIALPLIPPIFSCIKKNQEAETIEKENKRKTMQILAKKNFFFI